MPKKAQNKPEDIKADIIKAALSLAESKDWNDITLADIAAEADQPLETVFVFFEDRNDILAAYGRQIDHNTLADFGEAEAGSPIRDRLFEIFMARFDILNENREALKNILRSFRFDPKQAVISLPHLGRSMSWMLEACGISTGGKKGAVKVIGMTALYFKTLKTWCDDDSPDMGKTMAALDQNLDMAEKWANTFRLNNSVEEIL